MKNKMSVVDKICRQVRDYYHAHTPLIMIDTEEIELANRVAARCNTVELFRKAIVKNVEIERYVKFFDLDKDLLETFENFSAHISSLKELCSAGMNDDHNMNAKLVLLSLNGNSDSTGNPENISIISALRNYVRNYVLSHNDHSPLRSSCVLLYGDPTLLPDDIKSYTQIITVDYPDFEEIKSTVLELAENFGHPFEKDSYADEIARSMLGFTLIQVEFYTSMMLYLTQESGEPKLHNEEARRKIILEAKKQNLKRYGGLLKLYYEDKDEEENRGEKKISGENQIGGMSAYVKWVEKIGITMRNGGRFVVTSGTKDYKGTLFVGVPGCGKSEAAKVIYRQLGIPMLRLDIDALMGGLLGQSERNLRQALSQAEAMAPCVLWIDELDKGLSGATNSSGDGGTFKRMFGHLLTWLQEKESPCFVFATANDISKFPPELFRSGRFDVLYGVFMPNHEECKSIFSEQMKRAERRRKKRAEEFGMKMPQNLFSDDKTLGCFTDEALESIMKLFTEDENGNKKESDKIKFVTGADIEKIIISALRSFPEEKLESPISFIDWKNALEKTINDSGTVTLGSSYADLNKIAACYVRLLRKSFVPVGDNSLFENERYKVEYKGEKIEAYYQGDCKSDKYYDEAFFKVMKDRISLMAARIEENEYMNDCC